MIFVWVGGFSLVWYWDVLVLGLVLLNSAGFRFALVQVSVRACCVASPNSQVRLSSGSWATLPHVYVAIAASRAVVVRQASFFFWRVLPHTFYSLPTAIMSGHPRTAALCTVLLCAVVVYRSTEYRGAMYRNSVR